MPMYDYQCESCEDTTVLMHKMSEEPELECPCGGKVRRVILTPPATVVPPQHQAAGGSKLTYYGVKNIQTGQGIEKLKKGWNDGGQPGIRVKKLKD